jgi:hypothetical protein
VRWTDREGGTGEGERRGSGLAWSGLVNGRYLDVGEVGQRLSQGEGREQRQDGAHVRQVGRRRRRVDAQHQPVDVGGGGRGCEGGAAERDP